MQEEPIGEGAFGRVYKATKKLQYRVRGEPIEVAAKFIRIEKMSKAEI